MNNSAETFIRDINSFASGMCLDNNIWRLFGYKKRPKRGSFFNRFINEKKLFTEKFILREIYIICIINAISFIENEIEVKDLILKRTLDQFFSYQGIIEALYFTSEFEAYNYFYKSLYDYLNSSREEYNNIFINRSQNILGNLFNSGWIVSFIRLNSVPDSAMYDLINYLKSKHEPILINDIIFNSEFIANN